MKYDSKRSKTITNGERKCPYCNSLNIKEYLYGAPSFDYDKEKYVLGGCEVSLDNPKYKCMDCGKDIYVEHEIELPNLIIPSFTNNNRECILIDYSDKDSSYAIKLTKSKVNHAGVEDFISSICLKKIEYNSVYKIDDVQHLQNEDFDKYYKKLMQITSNWISEFDNNKLVINNDIREWSLVFDTNDNQLSFSDNKVPSNINELKDVILELEELYKLEFKKRREQLNEMFK